MKVFWTVGILVIVGIAIAGGVLGFSEWASYGIWAGIVGAIFMGIVAVLFAIFVFVHVVNFIYELLRGFPRR